MFWYLFYDEKKFKFKCKSVLLSLKGIMILNILILNIYPLLLPYLIRCIINTTTYYILLKNTYLSLILFLI